MSPNDQRIAIAKAAGWKLGTYYTECNVSPSESKYSCERDMLEGVPDYVYDLNAMHEAEKVLTWKQRDAYRELLTEAEQGAGWNILHATAAQRAEAFLRTLNLWTES